MEPFGTARLATEGAVGFDCAATLHGGAIAAFAAAGFSFACRYVSRGEETAADLQASEVAALHAHGLAVVVVQHVARPPWTPSADLGLTLGHEAAADAAGIGCPAGVVLWLDLEGVGPGVKASATIGFCNSWFAQVEAAGYGAGLYVGVPCGLTSSELYRDLTVTKYWRSLSRSTPPVDVRGSMIQQSLGSVLSGVPYDRDHITKDRLGDLFNWWAA
jgi:hypothetical protein